MTSADAIALLVVGCYVVLAMLSHRAFIAFEKASDKPSLSPEMLAIMAAGIPVLAIVPDKQLGAWQHFTGWQSAELAADTAQILAWFDKTGRR